MKTLKKAKQQNVQIDKGYYCKQTLKELLNSHEIWYLKEQDEREHEYDFFGFDWDWDTVDERDLRIGCEDAELKVILDQYGFYRNVLIKNGKEYFVTL